MKYFLYFSLFFSLIGCQKADPISPENDEPDIEPVTHEVIRLSGCNYILTSLGGFAFTGSCPGLTNLDSIDTPVDFKYYIVWFDNREYIVLEDNRLASYRR